MVFLSTFPNLKKTPLTYIICNVPTIMLLMTKYLKITRTYESFDRSPCGLAKHCMVLCDYLFIVPL